MQHIFENQPNPKLKYLPVVVLAAVTLIFFYKTFLYGLLPFPGDLLISEYKPWQSYSFLGYNPGSYPNKAQYFDTIRQTYPWRALAIDLMKTGKLPLWNPYNFSGSPLLANIQSAVFYPLNILFFLFSFPTAWSILVILQPLLASSFVYLYMRSILVSRKGALLSAITYGYALYTSVFLEYNTMIHVIAWLPLSLYAIERILWKGFQKRYIGVFVISAMAAGFAGHLQLYFISMVFIYLYAIIRIREYHQNVNAVMLLTLITVSIGTTSIIYIPAAELILHSARANQSYDFLMNVLLFQPKQIILPLIPDIFGNPATRNYLLNDPYPGKSIYTGIIPFIFALSVMLSPKRNRLINLFTITAAGLFIFYIHSPITALFYKFPIPIISSSSPTNGLFLVSLSMAILAGIGLDRFMDNRDSLILKSAFLTTGVIILSVSLFKLFHIPIMMKNAALPLGIALFSCLIISLTQKYVKWKNILPIVFFVLTVLDLFYYFQKFNPFVPADLFYPKTTLGTWISENAGNDRFWGYGNADIQPNFNIMFRGYSAEGYDPLYPKAYGQLLEATKNGKMADTFTNLNRSDATIAPGYGKTDLVQNPYRLALMKILGVKYVLDRKENGSTELTFPDAIFSAQTSFDDWNIFRLNSALPRVNLYTDYDLYKTESEFENMIFRPDFHPDRKLLLTKSPGFPSDNSASTGSAVITSYSADRISINTDSFVQSLLFLSDTDFPGWQALVDSRQVPVIPADYAFRAVVVPAGKHTVLFSYLPKSIKIGATITGICIALILLFCFQKDSDPYVKKN